MVSLSQRTAESKYASPTWKHTSTIICPLLSQSCTSGFDLVRVSLSLSLQVELRRLIPLDPYNPPIKPRKTDLPMYFNRLFGGTVCQEHFARVTPLAVSSKHCRRRHAHSFHPKQTEVSVFPPRHSMAYLPTLGVISGVCLGRHIFQSGMRPDELRFRRFHQQCRGISQTLHGIAIYIYICRSIGVVSGGQCM